MRWKFLAPALLLLLPILVVAQTSCPSLSLGSSGPSVIAVQKILYSSYDNFPVPTGYFGTFTQAAIQQWQKEHGITSSGSPSTTGYGAVGPKTASAMGLCNASQTPTTLNNAQAPTASSSDAQSLIASLKAQVIQLIGVLNSLLTAKGLPTVPTPDFSLGAAPVSPSVPTPTTPTAPTLTFTTSTLITTAPTSPATPSSPPPTPTPLSCSLNGQNIASGSSLVAYLASSIPFGSQCVSETRTCTNGTLSGSYQYNACSIGGAASCALDSVSVAHGSSNTFYSSKTVPFGSLCATVSQSRTCGNGTLSGNAQYQYASCTPGAASSCSFNNQSVASGSSVNAYQAASVTYGSSCVQQTRSCTNGVLSGTYAYPSCVVGTPASCIWNGQTIAHSTNVTAYQAPSVAFGSTCISQTRTCSNGVLSGTYQYPSCSANAPASCTFNGQSVAHGVSVSAYQTSSVAYGSVCTAQTRTCTDGTLSGSYTNTTCTVAAAASCTFNGQALTSGASVVAYAQSSVASGQSCVSETRACTNGTLNGSYQYAQCVVNSPTANGTVEEFGAVGDGVRDDTVALQAAVDAGVARLSPGKTYRITRSILITRDSSGIVGDGTPTIYMPASSFNNSSTAGALDKFKTNAIGIFINQSPTDITHVSRAVADVTLSGFKLQSQVQDGRYISGIIALSVSNLSIRQLEIWGLPAGAAMRLGSVVGGVVENNYIHDMYDNTAWGSRYVAPNLTAIEFDNDVIGDVPSSNVIVRNNTITNLSVGPAYFALASMQTDGVRIGRWTTNGLQVLNNTITNVGQGVDIYGYNNTVSGNLITNAFIFGIKLIHGAHDNTVSANSISGTGAAGIVLVGTSLTLPGVGDTRNNRIVGNAVGRVDQVQEGYWSASTLTSCFQIFPRGSDDVYIARDNVFDGNHCIPGANGQYAIRDESVVANSFVNNTLYRGTNGYTYMVVPSHMGTGNTLVE